MHPDIPRRRVLRACLWLILLAALLRPSSAHASLFHEETLDAIANGISWVVLVIAPIIGIVLFWLVHILPEKIADSAAPAGRRWCWATCGHCRPVCC